MSAWASVTLNSVGWWPGSVPSLLPGWSTGPATNLVRVGDVATVRSVASPIGSPMALVTPGDVDVQTGHVAPARASEEGDALTLGDDLRVGDVLVPSRGNGPCVLVSDELRGVAFRGFLVARAAPGLTSPTWLWSALTSKTGASARHSAMSGSVSRNLSASSLAEVLIPAGAPAAADCAALVPHPLVVELPGRELRSTWSMRDLHVSLAWTEADPDPVHGTSLGELGKFWRGGVAAKACYGVPGPGRARVWTHRDVRGRAGDAHLWSTEGRRTTDATVVFTSVEPFRAALAPSGVLLSTGLVGLDVEGMASDALSRERNTTGGEIARSLVNYFVSHEGRTRLVAAAHGGAVGHLSVSALGRIRVNRAPSEKSVDADADENLADRLDAALRRMLIG